jgi:hypothetical protein
MIAPPGYIRGSRIHHNVFVNDGIGIKALGPTDNHSNVFSNNIISIIGYGRAYWIAPSASGNNPHTNYSIDHDLVFGPHMDTVIVSVGQWSDIYNLSGWRALTAHADRTVGADPLFTDAARNWTLRSTSPAINAGEFVSGVQQTRQGGAPDIGADEYAPGRLGSSMVQKLRNRHKAIVAP